MTENNTTSASTAPTARLHARMAAARRKRLRRYAADILLASHLLGLLVISRFSDFASLYAGCLALFITLAAHSWLTRVGQRSSALEEREG